MCKVFSFFNSVRWEALYHIVFLHIFLFKCLGHVYLGINMGGQINPLYFLSVFELYKPVMQPSLV